MSEKIKNLINGLKSISTCQSWEDEIIKETISVLNIMSCNDMLGQWISLVTRPMTNEEREYYSEQIDYHRGDAVIYDCPLPKDEQNVLITTKSGRVYFDTFCDERCDFKNSYIEDNIAWMPLPEPYCGAKMEQMT